MFFFEAEKSVSKTRPVPLSACIFLAAEKAAKKDTALIGARLEISFFARNNGSGVIFFHLAKC